MKSISLNPILLCVRFVRVGLNSFNDTELTTPELRINVNYPQCWSHTLGSKFRSTMLVACFGVEQLFRLQVVGRRGGGGATQRHKIHQRSFINKNNECQLKGTRYNGLFNALFVLQNIYQSILYFTKSANNLVNFSWKVHKRYLNVGIVLIKTEQSARTC